jgi:hypothetical protein
VTDINTVSVVQGVLKFTGNVLTALLSDRIVNWTGLPLVTGILAGVTCRFVGA